MKKRVWCVIMAQILIVFIGTAVPALVHAWNQSFHALVAKECLNVQSKYVASYNARIGSMVPDFAWYLRDQGVISAEDADRLHGDTTKPCLIHGDTTYLYEIASDLVSWWDYGSRYLVKGMGSHVCADIIAHNGAGGYVEKKWIDELIGLVGAENEEALHLALEFAVDALLVREYGLQLGDLLFPYRQADFVKKAVQAAVGEIPGLDLSQEFKKYVALMRALEKTAALYGPYLIRGEVDEGALLALEGSELFQAQGDLTQEGLEIYYSVLMILLQYPAEIRDTITAAGMHWKDALVEAIRFYGEAAECP